MSRSILSILACESALAISCHVLVALIGATYSVGVPSLAFQIWRIINRQHGLNNLQPQARHCCKCRADDHLSKNCTVVHYCYICNNYKHALFHCCPVLKQMRPSASFCGHGTNATRFILDPWVCVQGHQMCSIERSIECTLWTPLYPAPRQVGGGLMWCRIGL